MFVACCMPSFDAPLTLPSAPAALLPALTPLLKSINGPKPADPHKPGLKLDSICAWLGGFGNAKLGANYGPSLVAGSVARPWLHAYLGGSLPRHGSA